MERYQILNGLSKIIAEGFAYSYYGYENKVTEKQFSFDNSTGLWRKITRRYFATSTDVYSESEVVYTLEEVVAELLSDAAYDCDNDEILNIGFC